MATWVFNIDFQDGSGVHDISSLVIIQSIKRTRTLHNNLKPTVDTLTFLMHRNVTYINKFLSGDDEALITVTKDGSAFFKGIIRPNFSLNVREIVGTLKIECVDYGEKLNRKVNTTFAWMDYKVSDATTKTASIVHQLLALAGFDVDDDISIATIDKTIDYFVNIGGADAPSYWDLITDLLFEFGYVWYFDASGVFRIYDLFPADTSTTDAFDNSNMLGALTISRKLEDFKGTQVLWYPHVTQADAIVFSDTTGGTESLLCNIEIPADGYYPQGSGENPVYAEFEYEGKNIIIVLDSALDVTKDSNIDAAFTAYYRRADVQFHNTAASAKNITKFNIVGDVVYQGDQQKTKCLLDVDTEKIDTIETKFITVSADADRLAIGLARFYKYSDFQYTLFSKTVYALGGFVDVVDTMLGINNRCVIVKIEDVDVVPEERRYTLLGIADYNVETTSVESKKPSSAVLPAGVSGLNSAVVFLYKRGTTAPTKPSTTATYTFSTGVLTGHNNGWTQTVPATDGNPLWVITAVASATAPTDTDTIAAAEWSTQTKINQDGEQGIQGEQGPQGPQGEQGPTGPQGSPAPEYSITTQYQVFRAKPGEPYSPSSITLSLYTNNLTVSSRQWQYYNGTSWVNISGATAATYVVNPGDFTDARSYRCVVNSTLGTNAITISKIVDAYKNLLDLSGWQVGAACPPTGWTRYGATGDNNFVLGLDHNGFPICLMEGTVTSGTGWINGVQKAPFIADLTKYYRFCVYLRHKKGSNGLLYFGPNAVSNLWVTLANVDNSNPYILSGVNLNTANDLNGNPLIPGDAGAERDFLLIGVIHPAGSASGYTGISGLYDAKTGEKLMSGSEFRFKVGGTGHGMRVGLYNCTDTSVRRWYWGFKIDEINGKDDSIDALAKKMVFDLSTNSAFINSFVGCEAFIDAISARILKSLAKCDDGVTPRTEIDLNNALIQARDSDNLSDVILEKAYLLFRNRGATTDAWEEQAWLKRRENKSVFDFSVSGFSYGRGGVLSNIGVLWQKKEHPFGTSSIYGIAYGNGVWIAVGRHGKIARSIDDGQTWGSLITNPFTEPIRIIAYGNGTWVAAGDSGKIARSIDDGQTWGSLITNPFTSTIRAVAYGNGVWVIGNDSGEIARSIDDGQTWGSLITNPFGTSSIYGIAYGNGVWVAAGDSGKIARSIDDGQTWGSLITNPFTSTVFSITYGNGVWIIVGRYGKIARSTDNAQTWGEDTYSISGIFQPYWEDGYLLCIGSSDKKAIIGGYLYSSSSGIICVSEWQEAGSGIVEIGENTSGQWIKFSDGTMICVNKKSISAAMTTSHGGLYISASQSASSFPHEFAYVHKIDIDAGRYDAQSLVFSSLATRASSLTGWPSYYLCRGLSATFDCEVYFYAIGRWK